ERGRSDKLVGRRGAGYPFGAGAEETSELGEDVVWGIEGELARPRVGVDDGQGAGSRSAAGVARAAVLVAHEVPDHPAFGPVVEVVNDVLGETQSRGPIAADAALGVEKVFVG